MSVIFGNGNAVKRITDRQASCKKLNKKLSCKKWNFIISLQLQKLASQAAHTTENTFFFLK